MSALQTLLMDITPYLYPAIVSFSTTVIFTLIALKVFPKLGLIDRPKKYGLKRNPIPYYGGIVIYAAFLISILAFLPLSTATIGLLIGSSLIAIISFLDDLYDLSPWLRLGVQFLSATIIVLAGIGISSITNPLGAPLILDGFVFPIDFGFYQTEIALLSAGFTIVWILAITNTMNFLDGLNGLPSGVTAIAAFTLFLLSVRPDIHHIDQSTFATLSIIVAMVCLGFWIFDFYPAKILMGDTGSMFLGFVLAVLAIFSGGKIATAFLVLGLPLLDMVWVIIRRTVFEKRSPMIGDLKHFHHRLLDIGLSDRKALFLIYSVCAIFGFLAVFLESKSKLFAIISLGILMIILGTVVVKKSRHG